MRSAQTGIHANDPDPGFTDCRGCRPIHQCYGMHGLPTAIAARWRRRKVEAPSRNSEGLEHQAPRADHRTAGTGNQRAGAWPGTATTVSPPFLPGSPVAPVVPVLPVAPVAPLEPVEPVAPVDPVAPAGPVGPGTVTTVAGGALTTVGFLSQAATVRAMSAAESMIEYFMRFPCRCWISGLLNVARLKRLQRLRRPG